MKQLLDHSPQIAQSVDWGAEVSELDADSVHERVASIFRDLWQMYEGRRAGISQQYGETRFDDDIIATRLYDGRDIEEIWWRTTESSPDIKNGQRQHYFVTVIDDTGERQISVSADHKNVPRLRIKNPGDGTWSDASVEMAEALLFDLEHRASDAKAAHAARTSDQNNAANAAALEFVRDRYANILPPVSA